jgi:general secretion pathway protein D
MVAMQSKTFWRPVLTKAIFVASEDRRKDFEDKVMSTFYLCHASTPAELREVVSTLKRNSGHQPDSSKSHTQRDHAQRHSGSNGTARKLVSDIDKLKAEVVIDIAVLQTSGDPLRTLGTVVPSSISLTSWLY